MISTSQANFDIQKNKLLILADEESVGVEEKINFRHEPIQSGINAIILIGVLNFACLTFA